MRHRAIYFVVLPILLLAPIVLLNMNATPILAASGNVAEDNFARADATNTWNTTTNNDSIANYAWQRSLGSSPYVSINSDTGTIIYTGTDGHKVAGYVNVPSNAGGDILEKVTFTNVGQAVAGGCLDVQSGTSWYQVDMNTDLGTLEIRKRLSGIMTTEAFVHTIYSANTAYWLREDVQISGGIATVQARTWQDNTTEPTNWQVVWSDSNPLPAGQAGAMGDWFKVPPAGTQIQFESWSYAAVGLAQTAQ